jgi:hypothetical protein
MTASPTATIVYAECATRVGDGTPDLHAVVDESEALHAVKIGLVMMRRGMGLGHLLPATQLPHLPSHQESTCCSL